MKTEKLYFCDKIDAEMALTKSYFCETMKEMGLLEIKVSEAIRELNTDYYYCKAYKEVYIKGTINESCGKECLDYLPRNGKNGCCKHRGFCYAPGKDYVLKVSGKLIACE
jgi:hypothetical protein